MYHAWVSDDQTHGPYLWQKHWLNDEPSKCNVLKCKICSVNTHSHAINQIRSNI